MAKKKELTIEQSFKELDEIISKMQSDEITLDESFALYEAGIAELRNANSKIEKTLQAVQVIKDGGLEVFEEED